MPPLAVLVMDNDPFYLRLATRFLQQRDDVVVLGSNLGVPGELPVWQYIFPDIIFLNLGHDTDSGVEYIRRIRCFLPASQIVVLASADQKTLASIFKSAGANDVIIRPKVLVETLPLIWQTISRRRAGQMIS